MRKLIREPLFHFILLGAGIFILYYIVQKDNAGADEIVITNSDVTHIASLYEAQWHRDPTPEELTSLISDQIRQEVFYREALRMNLEQNDEIVKQRLAQKMEFLSNDLSKIAAPATDDELKTYFNKNKEDFMAPYSYSFYQIVFTPERHTDTRQSAEAVLSKNMDSEPNVLKNLGDRSSLPFLLSDQSATKIKVDLGQEMADTLSQLPMNKWVGPIKSAYGWHLVFITEKTAPHLPEFNEVKNEVKNRYETEKEKNSKSEVYGKLRENYKIQLTADTLNTAMRREIEEKINGEP